MTLKELRYLLAVADEGHFGRAAKRCHVSQPTLSIAIRKLEDDLGIRLLARNGTGATLTPVGRQVAEHAVTVLAETETIRELVRAERVAGEPLPPRPSMVPFTRLNP